MERTGERTDMTSYLLGERSELRPLLKALAAASDDAGTARAAVEYLLVLAAARQAASGQAPEQEALAQIRAQYSRVFTRDRSEHTHLLKELHSTLQGGSTSAAAAQLRLLGLYHRKRGRYQLARASFAVLTELAKQLSDPLERLDALFWLGIVERYLGDLDASEAVHCEQLELAREVGHQGQAVLAQENLGLVAARRGRVVEARERVATALSEAQELEDPELQGYCYHALLVVEITAGRPGEAAVCGWEAYRRYQSTEQRLRALRDCAALLFDAGLYDASRAAYEIVLGGASHSIDRIYSKCGLAEIAAVEGDLDSFEMIAQDLMSEEALTELPYELFAAHESVGKGYAALGKFDRARQHLERSLVIAEDKGFSVEARQVREELVSLPLPHVFEPLRPVESEYSQLEDVGRRILAERVRAFA